jgi:hypothetical protein
VQEKSGFIAACKHRHSGHFRCHLESKFFVNQAMSESRQDLALRQIGYVGSIITLCEFAVYT